LRNPSCSWFIFHSTIPTTFLDGHPSPTVKIVVAEESNQNESSRSGLQHFVRLIPQVLGKKGIYMSAAIKEINDLNMYTKKVSPNSKQIPHLRSQIMYQMRIQ
jgi:hypothetical protein